LNERDRRIIDVIRSLRDGEVVSYGDIAADAGYPKQSRLVGRLLSMNDDFDLPWWRVVNSVGRLVPDHERDQAARLRSEGVLVRNDRVQSARFGRFAPSPSAKGRGRQQ
jgi:methylated-DNA-protein-cysteine methyltransferase-like protein